MPGSISKYGWLCGLLLWVVPVTAQTAPDATVAGALSGLSARAGVVFAGEVVAVRRVGGVVEVEFSVDQMLKGPDSGDIVLREWAGLWAAGQRRYWAGERAVVFLNEVGKSGLSSSVDGMEGILPISPDATNSLSVDVQRLRTRVLRDAGAPLVDSAERMSLALVTSAVQGLPVGVPLRPPSHPVPVIRLPLEGGTPLRSPPVHKNPAIVRQLDASY
jgi:hypothetical protein